MTNKIAGIGLASLWTLGLWAEELPDVPARGIQDNSFLVEEAYNQEKGVVQHIFNLWGSYNRVNGETERDWLFAFTQEWPVFSQTHQLSYTIPYAWLDGGGMRSVNGLGDILLNYRYQALMEGERRPAFAPRFSLILPTGDTEKGLGTDRFGYQFNLPFSKVVSERVTLHWNAGLTAVPDVQGRNPMAYNLGASAIYAVTRDFNLMVETLALWTERVESCRIERAFSEIISPGVRYAFNFPSAQLVLGIAAPIGLTRDAPDYGVFFYMSFEHGLYRGAWKP